jgi:hypothetical protein
MLAAKELKEIGASALPPTEFSLNPSLQSDAAALEADVLIRQQMRPFSPYSLCVGVVLSNLTTVLTTLLQSPCRKAGLARFGQS